MSTLEVNKITPQGTATEITLGDSGDTFTIPSGVTLTNNGSASGFGKIGQVVSVTKTDSFTSNAITFTDITGLTLNITPSSASSKILFTINVSYGGSENLYGHIRMVRNGSSIGTGTTATGSQFNATMPSQLPQANAAQDRDEFKAHTSNMQFLDSPSTTSQLTYKLQMAQSSTNSEFILNQPKRTDNGLYIGRYISTITAIEVLA